VCVVFVRLRVFCMCVCIGVSLSGVCVVSVYLYDCLVGVFVCGFSFF